MSFDPTIRHAINGKIKRKKEGLKGHLPLSAFRQKRKGRERKKEREEEAGSLSCTVTANGLRQLIFM